MKSFFLKINKLLFKWYYKRVPSHYHDYTFIKSVKILISNYKHNSIIIEGNDRVIKRAIEIEIELKKEISELRLKNMGISQETLDPFNKMFKTDLKEALEKEFKIDNKISREDLIEFLESLSYRQLERCNWNIPIVVDEYINKQFKPHPPKTEPKPNPLPNYRNPPPPPPVYKATVDRSGSEGRVFHDVVQYPLQEIKDDDPTTLLISIIILLGYIIYKIEKYFN